MSTRVERVKEALRREVSLILQKEVKDPRIGFTTVTKVEVSKDLKYAYIYYSVMGGDKKEKGTRHALASAGGYIRGLIGERLKMRYTPEIIFRPDRSIEHTRKVYEILDRIKNERKTDEQE